MERVIRVRDAGRDENDDALPGGGETPLFAVAVAPGSSPSNRERGRNGRKIDHTVFFWPKVDLKDTDHLVVRGRWSSIVVNEWVSPYTGRVGQEVLCSYGEG